MPFEIVGLDFVGREDREEDMSGVDVVGAYHKSKDEIRSEEQTRKLVKDFIRKTEGRKIKPTLVKSMKGDYLYRDTRKRFSNSRYYRVLDGIVSKTTANLKLGSPPSGVSGWWPFSRQMTPQEAEQKAENIMRKQNIQTGQGKVVSAKDFGNSIIAASKELGGQEIAKGYVLTVLARKGMGFMDSQGQTHWPSFAPQKA